jgi:hypothetical protein
MSRTRFTLAALCLVLLGLVALGLYMYQNLPGILRAQLNDRLQHHGVQAIDYTHLQFSNNALLVEGLRLRGAYGGLAYEALADAVAVGYDWRLLFARRIQSLAISGLQLSLVQMPSSDQSSPVTIDFDELLPYDLNQQLPLQTLQVEDWQLNYHSTGLPPLSASGTLLLDGHLDLQLASAIAGGEATAALRVAASPPVLDLAFTLREGDTDTALASAQLTEGGDDEWEWHLQAQWQYAPLLQWLRRLDAEPGLDLPIPAAQALNLQGQSTIAAVVRHPGQLQLGTAPGETAQLPKQLFARINTVNTIQQLDYPGTIEKLSGTVALDAQLENGRFSAAMQPAEVSGNLVAERLSLPAKTLRWLEWAEAIPVRWNNTTPLQVAFDEHGGWSVAVRDTALTLGENDTALGLHALQLDAALSRGEPPQLDTRLDASVETRLRKQELPQLALAWRQQGALEHSDIDLQLADATGSTRTALQGTINLATGAGQLNLDATLGDLPHFAATTLPLLQHFDLVNHKVEVRSGRVGLDIAITSAAFAPASWCQQSHLEVKDVSGSVGDYRFDGLALNANWSGVTQWQTQRPVEISLANLDLGFPVEDILAHVSLPKATPFASPLIRIDRFSAGLFGGRLLLPQAQSWDFAAPSNQLTLQAQQWQLADLVALQKNTDIQAQGTLEGELPMTITAGRLIIDDGYLHALPPGGSIRYTPNDASQSLAAGSPELGMALDLLSDFQYQVLSSRVQLDAAGNLLLGLSLQGSNPSRYEGQPINFNINLEQNLDPLLQSWRLSGKLVEQIEGVLQ